MRSDFYRANNISIQASDAKNVAEHQRRLATPLGPIVRTRSTNSIYLRHGGNVRHTNIRCTELALI